jgi:flagellar hook-length control protein FliK
VIVQGGNTFLSQTGQSKPTQKVEPRDDEFKDHLSGANKNKTKSKESRRPQGHKKKEARQDIVDGEPQKVTRDEPSPTKPREKESSSQTSLVQRANPSGKEAAAEQDGVRLPNEVSKKISKGEVKQAQLDDSINLSGVKNNSLGKKSESFKNKENPFEELVAEMKMQANQHKAQHKIQQGGLTNGLETKIGIQGNTQKSVTKIASEFDLSKGGETYSLEGQNSVTGKNPMNSLGDEGSELTSDQGMTHLESLVNQGLEQDLQGLGDESLTFADSVEKVEGGKAERVENLNSIVKQARAFVNDGGGSMEIHLQPEGLGKVQLKVAVNNGQVNVEMLADNMAAKKALEEGLFDIKSALEGQKLVVDTLKVEMSQDYQKDFTDLSDHMKEQANRDFAEQFLGQFRQEREERLTGMFDSFRNFQPDPGKPELTLRRNPYTESGKGRSINLVA